MTGQVVGSGEDPDPRPEAAGTDSGRRPQPPIPLVVFGAAGLLAGELLRLLESHPSIALACAATREGGSLDSLQPHLATGVHAVPVDHAFESTADLAARGTVAIAFALPHGESAAMWKTLRARLGQHAKNAVVVDLGADYRLADPAKYVAVYGAEHGDLEGLAEFAYGLPELNRGALCESRRAAAAGCFATAMQLAVVPAVEADIVDLSRPILLSGVTGSSGSGNKPAPNTHHPHRDGNFFAYSLAGHRHEAELAQMLRRSAVSPAIHFVPHSGPFVRGIHLTAFLPVGHGVTADAARQVYVSRYQDEPFVAILPDGMPDLRRVAGSNRVCIGLGVRGSTLTVCLTLDNIVKGGAGQALQCLNLMLGLDESAGLPKVGLGVV